MKTPRPAFAKHGFSLLELSIVLVVVSLIIGGVMAVMTQDARRSKQAELETKMDQIEAALQAYRLKNDRLPCPAIYTDTPADNTFGTETPFPPNCAGAFTRATVSPQYMYEGTIPVRALGLPDDVMFDPWGGRFTYAVGSDITAPGAFTIFPLGSQVGDIKVYDSSGIAMRSVISNGNSTDGVNTVIDTAVALVMSHGPNGHGAYQMSGKRKSSGSTNWGEMLNCACSSTGGDGPHTSWYYMITPTGSSSDPTQTYDDVVRYYTRSSFLSPNELITDN